MAGMIHLWSLWKCARMHTVPEPLVLRSMSFASRALRSCSGIYTSTSSSPTRSPFSSSFSISTSTTDTTTSLYTPNHHLRHGVHLAGSEDRLGVHLLACPDGVGHVSSISALISKRGGSLLSCDMHVEKSIPEQLSTEGKVSEGGGKGGGGGGGGKGGGSREVRVGEGAAGVEGDTFYSRSTFRYNISRWPREQMEADFSLLAQRASAKRWSLRALGVDPPKKIVLMVSTQDHCVLDLLHRWQDREYDAKIVAVVSNHPRAPESALSNLLRTLNVPLIHIPARSSDKMEEAMLEAVAESDFLVLARYMQVLSPSFLERYGKEIINIHHGLLPSFKGAKPYHQAFYSGVKMIGATAHFVTEELDCGPIIEQMAVRVDHRDSMKNLVALSRDLEKQCLSQAVTNFLDDRVMRDTRGRCLIMN